MMSTAVDNAFYQNSKFKINRSISGRSTKPWTPVVSDGLRRLLPMSTAVDKYEFSPMNYGLETGVRG